MEGIRKWTTGYLSKHWVTPAGEASAAAFLGCGCLQPGFFFSFSPSGEAPQGCQQPSHFTTEQNEATQRFTMWPDLAGPSLGGLNLPSTFMVAKHDWGGRGIWEKENWGNWRKGVCRGVVEMKRFLHITQVGIISKNSTGLCDFPPHFFINQGKKF